MLKKFYLTIISLCFFSGSLVYADISANITLNPENPSPKSSVTLTLDSYSFDVNTAIITWQANGKVILSGQGETTLTVKTGNVGETSQFTVKAETADGSYIQQSINVTPSSVTLIYEAPQSYVPLLYEGLSLPSDGGLVRVTAIPQISDDGIPVPVSKLSYTWYANDSVVKTVSGLGKQSATFRLDYLNNQDDFKVIIRSPKGNAATKTITVYPHKILPLLYTYDQILGPDFTSLVSQRFEAVKDFTFSLQPFYISIKEVKEPTYTWFLDGLPATPLGGRVLALHPKEDTYGTKMLSITLLGPDKRVQKAQTKVELIFDTRK
jgi:hypothetical protein